MTIGFFTDWLGESSRSEFWNGVLDAAIEHDANLLCFVGGALNSPDSDEVQSNVLYELESHQQLDGIILASGTIARHSTKEEFQQFYRKYDIAPMSSIGLQLGDVPSVLVDYNSGMYDAISHLIEVHDYRHIAYIGGSDEQLNVYKQVLADHYIPFDPALVYKDEIDVLTGNKGVATFLDERNIAFDALVCMDDHCAFGALSELESRDIRVPHDVALIGFGDVVESRHSTPALTTVRQPLREQGKKAFELVLKQRVNEPVDYTVVLPTELVVRQSCGCALQALAAAEVSYGVQNFSSYAERKDIFLRVRNTTPYLSQLFEEEAFGEVFDCFLTEVREGETGKFLTYLQQNLRAVVVASENVNDWQYIISALRQTIVPTLSEHVQFVRAENLLHKARLIVSDMAERSQARRRLALLRNSLVLHEVGQELLTTIHLKELLQIIVENVEYSGILGCYIAIYNGQNKQQARILLAYNGYERLEQQLPSLFFNTQQLLPDDILPKDRQYTCVVEELYFREEHLGYVVFEMGPRDAIVYSTMRRQLSSALKGALLLQERQEVQAQLRAANDELKGLYQAKDEFVSNVSHEFRTPLANLKLYLQLLERNPENRESYVDVLKRETTRLNMLIESLLAISRMDQSRVDVHKKRFDLAQLAEEYVEDRQLLARNKELTLQYIKSDRKLPIVRADISLIGQVISIFMSNAINYTPQLGSITVAVHLEERQGEQWVGLSMKDTGMGILPEDCERVFDRFYRGNSESSLQVAGTGLGLSIAKEIIELHGGHIGVESEGVPGKGSTFFFWIPV